jgi:hypothetical protein
VLLFAIEPPDDDTQLIVGIEKANAATRSPATVYRKVPRDHSFLPEKVWAVEEITDARRLTIRQWHEQFRTDRDHRKSDHWPLVLLLLITAWSNAPTLSSYEESGSDQGAAGKAINRWLKAGRIVKKEGGVYELGNG